MVMKLRMTLTTLSPFSTDKPPLAIEKTPPMRSMRMLKMDQPLVLLRRQFHTAAGVYLTSVMTSLP